MSIRHRGDAYSITGEAVAGTYTHNDKINVADKAMNLFITIFD